MNIDAWFHRRFLRPTHGRFAWRLPLWERTVEVGIMTTTKPSVVRERMLRNYRELSHALDALEGLRTIPARFRTGGVRALVAGTHRMNAALNAQIDIEREQLRPALLAADAWGKERAEHLAEHHVQRRDALSEPPPAEPGAAKAENFVAWLGGVIVAARRALSLEERDCMDAELLRDDGIGIGVCSE